MEFKQGENYLEEESSDEEEVSAKKPPQAKTIASLAIAVVILICIVALVVTKTGKKDSDETESEYTEQDQQDAWDTYESSLNTSAQAGIITYTGEEVEQLRKWGYTGDEIEIFQSEGTEAKDKISEAKELQLEAQKEIIDELSDTGSKAYKKLFNMTWLSGKPVTIKDMGEEVAISYEEFVENVDYVKCDAVGTQLFIRLTLDSGEYAFMTVAPERWLTLKKTGNMVIQYTLETYGDTCLITNIFELVQEVGE